MSNNVKVGILTVVGLVVLFLVLTWKTVSVVEVQGRELIGQFENISGLLESAEVKYRGFTVGKVVRIEPRPHDIMVHMKIDKSLNVPKDSLLVIGFDGLIGQKYIAIVPGTKTNDFCGPGAILPGKSSAGIVDFVDQGTAALEEAKKLLVSLREITDDPAIHKSIRDSLDNFTQLSKDLQQAGPRIKTIADNLDGMIAEIRPLFADGQFATKAKDLVSNIEQASNDLKDMTKSVRKITDDPDTEKNIRQIIENLKEISEELKGSFRDDKTTSSKPKNDLKDMLRMAKTFSSFRAGVDADMLYSQAMQKGTIRAGAQIAFDPKQYYAVRGGEIAAGQGAVLDIVQGNKVNNNFSWRWGIIQTGLGIGAEYTLWDRLSLMADLYGPDQLKTSVGTRYLLNDNWGLVGMAERMGERDGNYYVGVNVRP